VKVKTNVERNFRRAKVRPGRARRPRTRIVWPLLRHGALLALFLYAGYRAVSLIVHAAPLQIENLPVSGIARLSVGEVQSLVRGVRGHSILTADLDSVRSRVLESSWVADATVHRVLPSTIEIRVTERQPIGICRMRSRLYLIDRTGTVIDEFGPRYAEFDLPILDGLVRTARGKSPAIDGQRAALAARVMDAFAGNPIGKRLSQVDVSNLADVVVLLDDDEAALHLGDERFAERLQSYLEVASALQDRVEDIDYVDLRFEERMYVKPRGRTATARSGRPAESGRQD
jgi:cell division septal protein FtsQ